MSHCALSPGHRLISVGTTVLYGLLPQYSTDRVWHPILVANLTMALYFLSLFADLKQLARRSWIGPWKVVATASLVLSLLAYDLFFRVFPLRSVLVAIKRVQFKCVGKATNWGQLELPCSQYSIGRHHDRLVSDKNIESIRRAAATLGSAGFSCSCRYVYFGD